MKKLIAYCGLDCEKCEARKATLNDDWALREKVAKSWSEMNGVEITPEMINCEGCRADEIRQCALKKNCETCGNCAEMEKCLTVGMVISNNAEAAENLKNK